MANTVIRLKSSGSTGNVPSTLQPGELAINYVDGNLFYGNSTNETVLFQTLTDPAGLDTEIQFNDLGSFGSSPGLTFNKTNEILSTRNLIVDGMNVKPQLISAYDQSNNSFIHAEAAYSLANTLSINDTYVNAVSFSTSTGDLTLERIGPNSGNLVVSLDGRYYTQTESDLLFANSDFANVVSQNALSAGSYANSAFTRANTADQKAISAGVYANAAFTRANTATTNAATADQKAFSAGVYANAAFALANTKVSKSGDTMTGTLTFNNSTGTKLALNDSSAYWLATTTNTGFYWDTTNNTLEFHGAGTSRAEIDLDTGDATFSGTVSSTSFSANNITVTDSVVANSFIGTVVGNNSTELSTTTAGQIIDSFPAGEFRTAKYIVSMSHQSEGFHCEEVLLTHDDTDVYITSYAQIFTNESLGSISANISGSNVQLTVTPTNTFTYFNLQRTLIAKAIIGPPTGVWSTGGNLITGRSSHGGAGTQTAALAFGGEASGYTATLSSEEYNGTSWSSGGNLLATRIYFAGIGTQTAALAFGGYDGDFVATLNTTEEYNGTSWSSGGNLITARDSLGGAGTQDAGLAIAGRDSSYTLLFSTEEYNGTSWSSGGNLITARDYNGSTGTQTAALTFGGFGTLVSTEEYDGTSWSLGGILNVVRNGAVGAGTQTAALAAAGYGADYIGQLNSSEEYDGTSWSTGGTLTTGRNETAGDGTQTSALVFGGRNDVTTLSSTEEYNK